MYHREVTFQGWTIQISIASERLSMTGTGNDIHAVNTRDIQRLRSSAYGAIINETIIIIRPLLITPRIPDMDLRERCKLPSESGRSLTAGRILK